MPPRPETPTKRPVTLGCTMAVVVVMGLALMAVLLVVFLESGADNGRVVLLDERAYAPGTVTYVPEHGMYVIRLGLRLIALDDLDAANAAATGRRCRVRVIEPPLPRAELLLERFRSRLSPEAVGTVLLLTEDCNGAVYDIAGRRLDADGPNLDRLRVGLDERRRVVIDTQERTCTAREGEDPAEPRDCDR